MHHVIGMIGVSSGLIVGRMILTLSNATCITELSTPFVSLRALLSMHKKTSGNLYIVNGLLMTFSFLVVRVIFQTWLVLLRLAPAVFYRQLEMMSECYQITHYISNFSLVMYLALVFLNFFWFYKMFTGLMKFFTKSRAKKE